MSNAVVETEPNQSPKAVGFTETNTTPTASAVDDKSDVRSDLTTQSSNSGNDDFLKIDELTKFTKTFRFVDYDMEQEYKHFVFSPGGLWFPLAINLVVGGLMFVCLFMNFHGKVYEDLPWTYIFTVEYASWNEPRHWGSRIIFSISSGSMLLAGTGALVYQLLFVMKKNEETGKYETDDEALPSPSVLEFLWFVPTFGMLVLHVSSDGRKHEFCRPREFSLLMRQPDVPDKCEQFVDSYYMMQTYPMFICAARSFFSVPSVVLFSIPIIIISRATIGYSLYDGDRFWTLMDWMWFIPYVLIGGLVVANEYFLRSRFIQHKKLQQTIITTQRAQTAVNRLLMSMLPASVLKRMISGEKKIQDQGVASVLFSDIAGFTSWCSSRIARDVVSMLNTMYFYWDAGLKFHQVEKVKTIGDAYWILCGIPDPVKLHCARISAFSMFMLRQLAEMVSTDQKYEGLRIRIGIHTGSVCGGFVGLQQSSYDVFGVTNEVANQMEANAPVSGVLLSDAAKKQLEEDLEPMEFVVKEGAVLETADGDSRQTYVLQDIYWAPNLGDSPTGGRFGDRAGDSFSPTVSTSFEANNFDLAAQELLLGEDTGLSMSVSSAYNHDDDDDVGSPLHDDGVVPADSASAAGGDDAGSSAAGGGKQRRKRKGIELDENVEGYGKKISASTKSKIHHTFDNEKIEREYRQHVQQNVFPQRFRAVNVFTASFIFFILIMSCVQGIVHNPAIYIGLVILTIIPIVAMFISVKSELPIDHPGHLKFKIPWYVAVILFYGIGILLVFILCFAEPCITSNDLLYIPFTYTLLSPVLGPTGIPYFFVFVINLACIWAPQMLAQVIFKAIFVHHLVAPIFFFAIWVLGLRQAEIDARKQFINGKMLRKALHQTKKNHKKVEKLLTQMVPKFIVPRLTEWVCSTREELIADDYKMIGILFVKPVGLGKTLRDAEPGIVMARIGSLASACEQQLLNHPFCIKLKIIGDVFMVASGFLSADQTKQALLDYEQNQKMLEYDDDEEFSSEEDEDSVSLRHNGSTATAPPPIPSPGGSASAGHHGTAIMIENIENSQPGFVVDGGGDSPPIKVGAGATAGAIQNNGSATFELTVQTGSQASFDEERKKRSSSNRIGKKRSSKKRGGHQHQEGDDSLTSNSFSKPIQTVVGELTIQNVSSADFGPRQSTMLSAVGSETPGADDLQPRHHDRPRRLSRASSCSSRGSRASRRSEHKQIVKSKADLHHLVDLAQLAVDLEDVIQHHLGMPAMAGMHCGPVNAGIIGSDRLIFDVFGDAVNTASRVMSTSGQGVWASKMFSTTQQVDETPDKWFNVRFGPEIARAMKGKGNLHVVPVNINDEGLHHDLPTPTSVKPKASNQGLLSADGVTAASMNHGATPNGGSSSHLSVPK